MKNLLITISMLAITASASAQLYVSPVDVNATPADKEDDVPTFIYADKQVVFVTQGVQLEENPEGIYNASFYLRNKSQLIQGTGGTSNSGSGFLSVTQDSHSDSFDYNMWASPVSNQYFGSATASIAGNRNYGINSVVKDSLSVTDSRNALRHNGWNGRGSGMGVMQDMVISNRWIYKYENDSQGYQRIFGSDGVAPGYGFIMKGTNITGASNPDPNRFIDANNQRYDFRGRPNNGTISVPIFRDDNIMTGNPYPSALDLQQFWIENNAVDDKINSILFWDEDRTINSHNYTENIGGYAPCTYNIIAGFVCNEVDLKTYNSGGGSTGNAAGGALMDRRYAPIGQGFFVVTADDPGATGTISYENTQRVFEIENEDEASGGSIFRRPSSNSNNNTTAGRDTRNDAGGMMRFHTTFNGTSSHVRDMILFVSDLTTDGYDNGFDVYHPGGGSTDIYFPITVNDIEKKYVMQGVPYEQKKFIPLTIKVSNEPNMISIVPTEMVNFPAQAYFYDKLNNRAQAMTREPIEFTLDPGTYKDRFFIVLYNERGKSFNEMMNEEVNEKIDEALESVSFFQNNRASQLEVTNPEGYDIKSANIFDMTGKLVVSKNNIGSERNFYLPTNNLSDGVYLVKLTTADNVNIDYKMTVTN